MSETYENYRSINTTESPETKAWCVSVKMLKTLQQATVTLNNGKAFKYASRFPIADGDVAIIGNELPYYSDSYVYTTATTGSMGVASDVRSSIEIKRTHATELSFVFTPVVVKKMITECVKYIDMPGDGHTLQFDKVTWTIYPITFLIRKLLAATSILAFPKLAGAQAVENAKAYLCKPQIIDKEMSMCNGGPWLATIDLNDIHVDAKHKNIESLNEEPREEPTMPDYEIEGSERGVEIPTDVNEYVNRYAYVGAVSIMVRGGFVNLLNAFLAANPPIGDFYAELLEDIGENGNAQALAVLKEYKPA